MVSVSKKLEAWLLSRSGSSSHHNDSWWKVMCLTGVDYFSTLGYQPGIAYIAAALLSPVATLMLVIVTLVGALPVYCHVARESPHGQGSVAMLVRHMPGWFGKALVLILLGFAATDFIITITLSAADATAHIVENPIVKQWLSDRMLVTMFLLSILGGVFLKGFREAIGLAVGLVFVYLGVNAVVLWVACTHLMQEPKHISEWTDALFAKHGNIMSMVGTSLLLFPKLALGLSGFETGVAVMSHVKGNDSDTHEHPEGRIKNTGKLLVTAASIMSILLIISSLITTILIPAAEFKEGGKANGRALAFLAHNYLGEVFGTVYDISTIAILWFAGASAMAGLLNLVPRYLPRYGMAPEWASRTRPLVIFFMLVCFFVTWIFKADVDAQAGAYATGVLVLITSASVAVTLSLWKTAKFLRFYFALITIVFIYTSIQNMIERPEGLVIASFFIGAIFVSSLVSRAVRSLELRIANVTLDETAQKFLHQTKDNSWGQIRLLCRRPGGTDYFLKEMEARETHSVQRNEGNFIFLEVSLGDASDFIDDSLDVQGEEIDGYQVLKCTSPTVPNAIAALLLHIREETHKVPNVYFEWTEGNPLFYILKYIFLGEGETAPITREILRRSEPNTSRRPKVHVG